MVIPAGAAINGGQHSKLGRVKGNTEQSRGSVCYVIVFQSYLRVRGISQARGDIHRYDRRCDAVWRVAESAGESGCKVVEPPKLKGLVAMPTSKPVFVPEARGKQRQECWIAAFRSVSAISWR